jgi:hypothetical protein
MSSLSIRPASADVGSGATEEKHGSAGRGNEIVIFRVNRNIAEGSLSYVPGLSLAVLILSRTPQASVSKDGPGC